MKYESTLSAPARHHVVHEFVETEVKIRAMDRHIGPDYDDGNNHRRKKKNTHPYEALQTIKHFWYRDQKLSGGHVNMLDVMFHEQYLGHITNKLKVDTTRDLAEVYLEVTDDIYDKVMQDQAA